MHEVSCPVCGENISHQLPGIEYIFDEEFRFSKNFCIVNSVVVARLTFYHERNDEYLPLEVPHRLTAVIQMVFDSEGECTVFDIRDLSGAPDSPENNLEVNSVKEVKI